MTVLQVIKIHAINTAIGMMTTLIKTCDYEIIIVISTNVRIFVSIAVVVFVALIGVIPAIVIS
jgi:hypothetical protein